MAVNEREFVLDMLLKIEGGALGHRVLREGLDGLAYLEKSSRAFISRLYNGSIEKKIYLDYVINLYSKTPVKKMKPLIRALLELSVYQLLFMDRVPDSAAINEAVKLSKKRGFSGLSGFVNGVLRNISRKKDGIHLPEKEKDSLSYLELTYSMPRWLVERFLRDYGEETEELLEAFQKERGITIRRNPNLTGEKDLLEKLTKEGVVVKKSPIIEDAYYLEGVDSLEFLASFHEGKFYIQDESSQLVGELSGVKEGDVILDLCAAPGGKSIMLSFLAGRTGEVIACDVSDYKLSLIRDNIERMEIGNVKTLQNDASTLNPEFLEKADVVLCDLPCSGLGVIGKKRDIKYHVSEEMIRELTSLQRQMLVHAMKYVKIGGSLIFSTCTLTREENEENFNYLLEQPEFEAVDLSGFLPEGLKKLKCFERMKREAKRGFARVLPHDFGSDGFFISRFIRKS